MKTDKADGNLKGHMTNMPVGMFLLKFRRQDEKVAGLLDYGYDPYQIAEMLFFSVQHVHWIMKKFAYVTVDKLK